MLLKCKTLAVAVLVAVLFTLSACAGTAGDSSSATSDASSQESSFSASSEALIVSDKAASSEASSSASAAASTTGSDASSEAVSMEQAKKLFKKLKIKEDYRKSFKHGDKGPEYQKYIVLHDTEGEGDAQGVIEYWDGNERGVAAHFIVNKDGTIMQCVPLDKIAHHAGYGDTGHNKEYGVEDQIAHHAGYGDTGHNKEYGVEDESRDDKVGTTEIGDWASDYGMNSYSVGIEMIHVGGSGDYPEKQLEALDGLIAYIDAYYASYGVEPSKIIDHKAWRTGNSDTSEEFADYLKNYQDHRTHLDAGDSEAWESKAAA